jgi:fatty acid desaturase
VRVNVALWAAAVALAVAELILVPIFVLPTSVGAAIVVVMVGAGLTPFRNALIHEAIHGRLFAAPRLNDAAGRVLALASGVSFDLLRFGHLSHHRFNRHALDRPDVLPEDRPAVVGWAAYYGQILGGLYLSEVVATLAFLLPRPILQRLLRHVLSASEPEIRILLDGAERALAKPNRLLRLRLDAVLAVSLYAAAAWLYGPAVGVLLIGAAIRALVTSLQDNAPHYGTPAVIGADAHNTRLPGWLAPLFLHQNLHDVHHKRPDLAWHELPQAFAKARGRYDGGYFRQLVRQLRGPRRAAAVAPGEGATGTARAG